MVKITVNGQTVEVPEGTSVLKAAEASGVQIPAMCYAEGYPHFTSCMLCVVKECSRGNLIPSCSARVSEGLEIETDSDDVINARKGALDLLLSDHIGDCEGPCRMTCPAHMDIPLMIRQIGEGKFREALITVKKHIALPAVLGRICSAPCEAGCRRKQADTGVSICLLKRFVADEDLNSYSPYIPECAPDTGKRAAVVGAGPAGLNAAYYLRTLGVGCTVFTRTDRVGGTLLSEPGEDILPHCTVEAEAGIISRMGAEFRFGSELGRNLALADLQKEFDAVIIAVGRIEPESFSAAGLKLNAKGIEADPDSYAASLENVFAAGSCVRPVKLAVKAGAEGRGAAFAVYTALSGDLHPEGRIRFNSRIGKLREDEIPVFMEEAEDISRVEPAGDGFTADEAKEETIRCFRCDCRKKVSCLLREYADEYTADQGRYKPAERKLFRQVRQHADVVYEPGKCIKCGRCIRVTEAEKEELGLAFIGRGFDVEVSVPFNEPLEKALKRTALKVIEACPTGALSSYKGE